MNVGFCTFRIVVRSGSGSASPCRPFELLKWLERPNSELRRFHHSSWVLGLGSSLHRLGFRRRRIIREVYEVVRLSSAYDICHALVFFGMGAHGLTRLSLG